MAEMNMRPMRVLGFASLAGSTSLQKALAAVDGPPVQVHRGPGIVALLQPELPKPLIRRGQKAMLAGLHTVQRRLEEACQAGPFLPMDPSAACCPAGAVDALLETAWPALEAALAAFGTRHQWDVILRWQPEAVVAQRRAEIAEAASGRGPVALAEAVAAVLRAERGRREAALVAALSPAVLQLAAGGAAGTETEVAVTVEVSAHGEAAIEAALGTIAPEHTVGASVDMRGPLPPLSFAAVRLVSVEQSEIASAWHRLGLPEKADTTVLHQAWRQRAAAAHPDRRPTNEGADAAASVADLTEANTLLRPLLAAEAGPQSLRSLLRRAGHRLVVPAAASVARRVLEPMA